MAEGFTPINTQEEFNQRIQDRLARERATIAKEYEEKYGDYDQVKKDRDEFSNQIEGFQKTAKENAEKITGLETQLAEATKKASGLELENLRTQVAIDKGLPMEIRGRLNGATKEELEKDADSLKGLFDQQNRQGLPPFQQGGGADDYETTGNVNKDRAMKKFEDSLKIINE